jgi:hypothetical protein
MSKTPFQLQVPPPDDSQSSSTDRSADRSSREGEKGKFSDPLQSSRRGLSGVFETILRRFKVLTHVALIIPIYGFCCLTLGGAVASGIATYDLLTSAIPAPYPFLKYLVMGFAGAAGYFAYGFSLLLIVPFVNWILRAKLKPWRGSYYSLETIRWYLHNGATYLVRFTFLEFVTPTPFNLLFYRWMGMQIGSGTTINSTWISDPSLIEMGRKVTIGGSVTIVAHYGQGGYLVLAPVKIGDKVTVGLKATIMGGVTIGEGAKILPNSVVMPKTEIPAGETWGGVPARKIEKEPTPEIGSASSKRSS